MPRKPESKLPGLKDAKRALLRHGCCDGIATGDTPNICCLTLDYIKRAIRREEAKEKGKR